MPRDLFGAVTHSHTPRSARKWPTVVMSFVAHAAAILILLVIPLMATGALPIPKSHSMVMAVLPPPLPSPPPPPKAATTSPAVSRDAAPTETPVGITPESDIDFGFENRVAVADTGIGDGTPVGPLDKAIAEPPPPPAPAGPVRPGGQVKVPEKIHDVAPVYPQIALTVRKEGIVIVEATIGTDGRVVDARILRSEQLLDQAALDAVRQWTYTPTTLNGVAVPVVMTVTVRFQLQR